MGTRVENERSDIPNFHLMSYKDSGGGKNGSSDRRLMRWIWISKLKRKCLGMGFTLSRSTVKKNEVQLGFPLLSHKSSPQKVSLCLLLEGTPGCGKEMARFSSLQGEGILQNLCFIKKNKKNKKKTAKTQSSWVRKSFWIAPILNQRA